MPGTPLREDALMPLEIRKVQVWSGEIPDRPGAAAASLERLARSGADLEFVFTRPNPKKPETSVIFVAPIAGPEQMQAARTSGLGPALDVAMLAVEGRNRSGTTAPILAIRSCAARASSASLWRATHCAPKTAASISSCVSIRGGRSSPGCST